MRSLLLHICYIFVTYLIHICYIFFIYLYHICYTFDIHLIASWIQITSKGNSDEIIEPSLTIRLTSFGMIFTEERKKCGWGSRVKKTIWNRNHISFSDLFLSTRHFQICVVEIWKWSPALGETLSHFWSDTETLRQLSGRRVQIMK